MDFTWSAGPFRIVVCLAAAAIALGASSANGQVAGRLSEAEEIELGRLTAEHIELGLAILNDPLVTEYVSSLGTSLASHSDRASLDYHFRVVDTSEINAFSLPGGYIYVNRGLISAVRSEAELAGVLGHEIGHVVGRHGAEQAPPSSAVSIGFRLLDSLLGRGTPGQLDSMAAELAESGGFMNFSPAQEREADRFGVENLARSGYDPQAMISFFETLDALAQDEGDATGFFASHPGPGERATNVEDLLTALSGQPNDAAGQGRTEGGRLAEIQVRLASLPPPLAENPVPGASGPASAVSMPTDAPYPGLDFDAMIAARLAPVFRQSLGDSPRFDRIAQFDFDGDWIGDNNWDNAEPYPLPPVVYFNVSETESHYFVHYAVFHPRDYKGGRTQGVVLSEVIREGVGRFGDYDPTGLAREAVLAHENDMEGALVVAEKSSGSLEEVRVVYVETLAHNEFFRYRVRSGGSVTGGGNQTVRLEGDRPVLYIEPRGHGIEAYRGGAQDSGATFINYRHESLASVPLPAGRDQNVSYELVSMSLNLWPRAFGGENETYGGTFDYGAWAIDIATGVSDVESREVALGELGSAFRGGVGGVNMARPPWGWFDRNEEDVRLGAWFLTPAETIQRHFDLGDRWSTVYRHHPVMGVYRE